jgi:ribosomal protein S18 acetylase RimI-like enzyme
MTEVIPLGDLSAAQLDQLAELHLETMRTLLSDLGSAIVRRYYEIARRDPAFIGICAVDAGELSGYAAGTPDPGRLFAGLRTPARWFIWQLMQLAAIRPAVIAQLATSVVRSSQHALAPGVIELTYIGVAPTARGSGLGGRLLTDFKQAARGAGYTAVMLSVEADNAPAIGLYGKSGFRTVDTFREGQFLRHRMECRLTDSPLQGGANP